MEPTFIFFVETTDGEIIKAFTWCRDKQSGFARVKKDAADFNVDVARVWAEPVNVQGVEK